jgi:hypothetical protein
MKLQSLLFWVLFIAVAFLGLQSAHLQRTVDRLKTQNVSLERRLSEMEITTQAAFRRADDAARIVSQQQELTEQRRLVEQERVAQAQRHAQDEQERNSNPISSFFHSLFQD